MIKSILLPLDGSVYSESILKYGLYFARKFSAVLRVLTVVDIRLFDWSMATGADSFVPVMPSAEFQEESRKVLDDKASKVVEKAASILGDSGIRHEITKISGIPVDEICYYAKSNDLVIMGIRGEYERWNNKLLGATLESVTRQISKPLLLVDKQFKAIERLHCGYDGSNTANRALQFAAFFGKALELKIQVLSVFDDEEERKSVLKEAEQYLSPYETEFQLRHEVGDVEQVLVNAQNNAPVPSLMVIGSYGHSRLREAILGSTTVQVMRKAAKPILLAK